MDDSGGDLMPLVQDVLNEKDGLLFIAGSAKTHLMNGMVQNGGIIPRCLDVISNSIGKLQVLHYHILWILHFTCSSQYFCFGFRLGSLSSLTR